MSGAAARWGRARALAAKASALGVCVGLLVACGGADDGVDDNKKLLEQYACDMPATQANAARTATFSRNPVGYYTNSMTWDPLSPPAFDSYRERWPVTIDGTQYFLNTLLVLPRVGRNGIVFLLHGLGAAQATMSIDSQRGPEETEFIRRGYAVVYIARRGSFGSTGAMIGSDMGYTVEDVTSQKVSIFEATPSNIRYQSASMVAALDRVYTDARFRDHLGRMVLIGASGGTFTALYTAAQSPVFKSAAVRGLIRTTGSNSQDYLGDPYSLAGERYGDGLLAGATDVPSLWYAGTLDATSNPAQLACVFAYYQKRSKNSDQFYLVPGMNHGGFTDLWSPAIYPTFSAYMRTRGFPNF